MSSKNQVVIPAAIRAVLDLKPGQTVVFDVDRADSSGSVTLRRSPTLEELAGSVPNPPDVSGLSWGEIRARAWIPDVEERR